MLERTGFVVGGEVVIPRTTGEADCRPDDDGTVVRGDVDGLGVGDAVPISSTP